MPTLGRARANKAESRAMLRSVPPSPGFLWPRSTLTEACLSFWIFDPERERESHLAVLPLSWDLLPSFSQSSSFDGGLGPSGGYTTYFLF